MLSTPRKDGKLALKVLQESPLEDDGWKADAPAAAAGLRRWVPSRYNVRATIDDGRMILWNSLSSAMTVFTPEQVPQILPMLKKRGFDARREGVTGYLVDRGFLVAEGADEYRQFLLRFGQQHYQSDRLELILMASEDCNFRCKYCYEEFARGTMRPEVRQGIKRLVEKRLQRLNVLTVSWFGGEPLYGWPAIEELAPFFAETAKEYDLAYASHMTTNGYLLTPDIVDKLFAWKMDRFQITVDGAPENHDCNRPARDGSSTFWTIFENLKAMSKRPDEFSVNLRVNFDKSNTDSMDEFLSLLEKELGGDSRFKLALHAVGRLGGANDDQLEVCGDKERDDVVSQIKAIAYKRGLRFNTLRDVNRLGGQVCYAARPHNFLIGAAGQVMKCTVVLDMDERNLVGQLSEDGTLKLEQDRMALWTDPSFEHDEQCQKCVVLPSCQGISCPLPRIEKGERACVPTRMKPKAELIEAVKYPYKQPHKRRVLLQE